VRATISKLSPTPPSSTAAAAKSKAVQANLGALAILDNAHGYGNLISTAGLDDMIHHAMNIVGRESDADGLLGALPQPLILARTELGLREARRPLREILRTPDLLIERAPLAIDRHAEGAGGQLHTSSRLREGGPKARECLCHA
jgi:hypothetical protein